jgi:DNA-binding NarL/FixJ family response regulator
MVSCDAAPAGAELGGQPGCGPLRAAIDRTADRPERGTILVAHGDFVSRDGLAGLLTGQGHRVVQATGGLQALALIQRGGIDLLVSAIVMNDMDGLELLRALRDRRIALPVIAVPPIDDAISEIYLRIASLLGARRTRLEPLGPCDFLDDVRDLLAPPAG